MAEYLAPGVYVEETSFRAKSIEGVGTSTTAFVGPARRGPIAPSVTAKPPPAPPELLTSFGDFVRVFGGLDPLEFNDGKRINYLAHATLNYFNEGGGRLYVTRVAAPNAASATRRLAGADDNADDRVVLKTRFPGTAGNETVTVREILATATSRKLAEAGEGALMRARGSQPVEPAMLTGSAPPFVVREGGILRLLLKGEPAPIDVTFKGKSTKATSGDLPEEIDVDAGTKPLKVTIDGKEEQNLAVPVKKYKPEELAVALNAQIKGGYVDLEGGKKLVIATDRLGHGGTVKVVKNDKFLFDNEDESGTFNLADNNVPNLAAVTVNDLNELFKKLNDPAKFTAEERGGRLLISTVAKGDEVTLAVGDASVDPGKTSEHHAFGLIPLAPGAKPAQGSNLRVFRKDTDKTWKAEGGVAFALPNDPDAEAGNFITLTLSFTEDVFDDLTLVREDSRYIGTILNENPDNRSDYLRRLLWLDIGKQVDSLKLHAALFSGKPLLGDVSTGYQASYVLSGGSDGDEPAAGEPTVAGTYAAALEQLSGLEDVSIVASPGHGSFVASNYQAIQRLLQQHVEKPRAYRIGVLETPPKITSGQARLERSRIDSHRLAMYYPWVTVANPLARPNNTEAREIDLPPSGFVCGIYARNDVEHDVSEAPANEVVRSALRFESDVNFGQNQLLNPLGVNCLRFFPGRGYRVWGARTASSDPEWKYVNVRRYFNYLEASIDRGTQWAVFENNGPRLWQNIRETIEDFLYNEWVSNRLLGDSPKQAYFVKCDRSTMTQNDLDNGRLICLIGVAVLKPAEFVIFRIGQKTADDRS